MADNITKQTVTEIEQELSKLEKRLGSITSMIGTELSNYLNKVKDNTRNWLNEFEKGKDISKKVSDKLNDLQTKSNELALKRIRLEVKLSEAQKLNLYASERRIKQALYNLKLADQELDKTQTILYRLQQANEERKKQNNLLDLAKDKLKEILGPLKQMFTIASIFKIIIDAAINFNKTSVEIGKNLGYGADNADRVTRNFVKIAQSSNNVNVTTKAIGEAFSELVKATGFAYEFTADQLETQVVLTKQVGLQADEAAQIQRYGVLNNKTSKETYESFIKGLNATKNQLKVGIDFKSALIAATKVSGQLAANLGYNPERIAKAVVTAKAFGLELEDLKSTTSSLLDFGSSIEKELNAELLTGRQLNLERARAAALSGDQVTLAEEIAKNVGTAADFAKMNVLQQDALASSVGMTSDKLAETLRKREEAVKSGKSLAQVTDEEAKRALERQNIQEKFNAAILKLQDLIGNLAAGPLGSVLTILTNSLGVLERMTPVLKAIAAIYIGIKTTQLTLNALKAIETGLAIKQQATEGGKLSIQNMQYLLGKQSYGVKIATYVLSLREIIAERTSLILKRAGNLLEKKGLISGIGSAIMNAVSSVFKSPVGFLGPFAVPIALAAGATVGALGYKFLTGDDIISPGYGQRVLSTPEGSIALNNNDTIVAGTNLNRGGGNNNMETNNLLRQLIGTTQTVANKPSVINMDGKKVGTTLVQNSYKLA